VLSWTVKSLDTETVEGTARALEGIDDIESSDSLSLGMLSVRDRVSDDLSMVVSMECKYEYVR
jgi:hypothetical protein